MDDFSNLTFLYEGIQRIFRNAVVRRIRDRFASAYPEDPIDQLWKPFKTEERDRIRADSAKARVAGVVETSPRDDYDLLSVNHFFNLFDANFTLIASPDQDAVPGWHGRPLSEAEKLSKRQMLEWLRLIKVIRDPASHPSEDDFTFEDTFSMLDVARRLLNGIGLIREGEQIHGLMEAIRNGDGRREPLEGRLPSREAIVGEFVGRAEEISRLWGWAEDPMARRWAIAGEGGKGKTAIAYEFAVQFQKKAPKAYYAVIWLSAKRKRLLEGSIQVIATPDFSDLESALDQLLYQYGSIDDLDRPVAERQARALQQLREFPALVIVDDVDSLESANEDVVSFFDTVAFQTDSKVLYTSRRILFGLGAATTHVSGFSRDDAEVFIRSRCRLFGIDCTNFTKREVGEIIQVTEGSPLFMEDLLRLVASIGPGPAITAWREKGGAAARRYALGREIDLLSREALTVLVASCVAPGPSSLEALQSVTGLPEGVLTGAIGELQKLFLVPKPKLIEGEQRFEIGLNTRALVREIQGNTDLYRRCEGAHRAVSQGLPRFGRGSVAAIVRQVVLIAKAGRHAEAEQLLKNAFSKYPSDPDLFGMLGWVYRHMSPARLTDAREAFRRAWELKSRNVETYRHWAQMEIEQREWTLAAEAAEKGIKLTSSRRLQYMAGTSRSRLGQDLIRRLQPEKGTKELLRAKELLENALKDPESLAVGERALNAEIYRSMVITAEWLGDVSAIREHLTSWSREHPEDGMVGFEFGRLQAKFGLPPTLLR